MADRYCRWCGVDLTRGLSHKSFCRREEAAGVEAPRQGLDRAAREKLEDEEQLAALREVVAKSRAQEEARLRRHETDEDS